MLIVPAIAVRTALLPALEVLSSYLAHPSAVPLAFPAVHPPCIALSGDASFVKFRAAVVEIRLFSWLEALSDNLVNISGPHAQIPSVSFSAYSLRSPPSSLAVLPRSEHPSLVCSFPFSVNNVVCAITCPFHRRTFRFSGTLYYSLKDF